MTFEEEIAARCFKFEEEFKMNKLGFFLLKKNDMKAIEMSEVEKQFFFGPIDDSNVFSRGMGYYQPGISPQMLKKIKKNIEIATEQKNKTILYALNEYLLNHASVIWYNLNYNQRMENRDIVPRMYQQLMLTAGNIFNMISGDICCKCPDWDFLLYIVENVRIDEEYFRVPECDNKVEIIKEICWLIHSGVTDEIDGILFPMCGSLNLMIFASILLKKKFYPINLGFHDQLNRKMEIFSEIIPKKTNILVLDDNIGSGDTIRECRKRLEKLGCNTVTRVCEIPWDVFSKINNFDVIRNALDMPSPKENFRNLSKKIFIQRMKAASYEKIYQADHMFINSDAEIEEMNRRILFLKEANAFSEMQLGNMQSELEFYVKTYRMRGQYV
ncbi:MAG: phosphoribosyltransferase [Lachnospiraceae bacterium]|nr:phosphoribosyltransferase [Lachnospiraceae bacterium]